jgi:beta-glucanase (GH16 family)
MRLFIALCFVSLLIHPSAAQDGCGWQPDSDGDFLIGVSDLLGVLGIFGQVDSDQDGLWDGSDLCTDTQACNFDADPSEACVYLDAFGVCGGSNDVPELLLGSWRLSTLAGAIEAGPAPGSNEWFSSPANGLQPAQYDDIYTFSGEGSLAFDYNGSIIDAFADYSEQAYNCSGVDFNFTPGGTDASATLELLPGPAPCNCPFIGTNDGGLVYEIISLTANELQLQVQGDGADCNAAELYFSYSLVRVTDDSGGGTDYPAADEYPGMTLVWSDEFDGTAINANNWTYDLGASGWGNNEWQNYTSSSANSSVENGLLTITARQEGSSYTSARMKSEGLQDFQFGRIDIRAKLPEGQGIWPALWMLGVNFSEGGWPQCGEIDIMEMVGHMPSTVHGTAHWGSSWNVWQYTGSSIDLANGEKFSDAFHLFSVDWQENGITWYMDDQPYFSLSSSQMNGQPYPFNASFFFIMNIAVGGNWPGYPDASTSFPQEMIVDCVRVFQ